MERSLFRFSFVFAVVTRSCRVYAEVVETREGGERLKVSCRGRKGKNGKRKKDKTIRESKVRASRPPFPSRSEPVETVAPLSCRKRARGGYRRGKVDVATRESSEKKSEWEGKREIPPPPVLSLLASQAGALSIFDARSTPLPAAWRRDTSFFPPRGWNSKLSALRGAREAGQEDDSGARGGWELPRRRTAEFHPPRREKREREKH
jgi:hypothetical protein